MNVTNTDSNLEVERNYTVFVTNNNWQKIVPKVGEIKVKVVLYGFLLGPSTGLFRLILVVLVGLKQPLPDCLVLLR